MDKPLIILQLKSYANLAAFKLIDHWKKQQSSILKRENHEISTELGSLDQSLEFRIFLTPGSTQSRPESVSSLDKVTRLSGIESFLIVLKLVVFSCHRTKENRQINFMVTRNQKLELLFDEVSIEVYYIANPIYIP